MGFHGSPSDNNGELRRVGEIGRAALKEASPDNKDYLVQTIGESWIPYIASGTSMDWAQFEAEIPYSYTMELRDSRFGFRFKLPANQIIPTGQEVWGFNEAVA